jgi:hypothetical protein
MTENPQERQYRPDEVPADESLDVEGPNESAQPSGAPGLDDAEEAQEDAEAEGEA